jgi:methyltransferase (TIGR00027 family)
MTHGTPSRTALGVARRRALHQTLDHPVVFEDPLAVRILADNGDIENHPSAHRLLALRAFVAARSRFAEDQLASSFSSGVRQYVILGAGLYTFAYRNPFAPDLRVFEIDHPDTQSWKHAQLSRAGIKVPDSLTFLPVDFEQQTLSGALASTPLFHRSRPAFFSMLGVTPYLTQESLRAILNYVAALPSKSGITFDYAVRLDKLNLIERVSVELFAAYVTRLGEPLRLFLDPDELGSTLRDIGFHSIEDLDALAINSRYFQNRSDPLRVGRAGRLLCACV